jgi:NitT/TauT family transport system permease protein
VTSIVAGLVLWQFANVAIHNELLMAGPIDVVKALPGMIAQGYGRDVLVTAQEFLIGLAIAIVLGVIVGTAMALNRTFRNLLQPWISAVYATPLIALAPVVILWFGIGLPSKVFVVVLVGVFPVIVNTESGVGSADRDLVEMARTMGLSQSAIIWKIYVRAALPLVVAGIRLAVAHGLTGVIVAELFGAKRGIGYEITKNTELYDMAVVFACIWTLAIVGIILSAILRRIERKLRPWEIPA